MSLWNLTDAEVKKLKTILRSEGVKSPKVGYCVDISGNGEEMCRDNRGYYLTTHDDRSMHGHGRFDKWITSLRAGAKEGRSMRARDKGIRSYGPGKFYTILDSLAYEVVNDGGADADAAFPDGNGFYARVPAGTSLLKYIEKEQRLTDEERELVRKSVGVIFFERSDGIVEAEWFSKTKEMDKVWKEIEADTEEANREDGDE